MARFPATCKAMKEAGYERQSYSRCSGCQAAMEWWFTPAHHRIPMDPMPEDDSPAVSHFVTCPVKERFRKPVQKVNAEPTLFDLEQL